MGNWRLLGESNQLVNQSPMGAPAHTWVSVFSAGYWGNFSTDNDSIQPFGHWGQTGKLIIGDDPDNIGKWEAWFNSIGSFFDNLDKPSKMRITFRGIPEDTNDWGVYISDKNNNRTYYDGAQYQSKEEIVLPNNIVIADGINIDMYDAKPKLIDRIPARYYDTTGYTNPVGSLILGTSTLASITPIPDVWIPASFTYVRLMWLGTVDNINIYYTDKDGNTQQYIETIFGIDPSEPYNISVPGILTLIEFQNTVDLTLTMLAATVAGVLQPKIEISNIEFYI